MRNLHFMEIGNTLSTNSKISRMNVIAAAKAILLHHS